MMEKYQPRGKERGWYEDQGEEYLFIKAPAVSCRESERKREKNSVNRSDCDQILEQRDDSERNTEMCARKDRNTGKTSYMTIEERFYICRN